MVFSDGSCSLSANLLRVTTYILPYTLAVMLNSLSFWFSFFRVMYSNSMFWSAIEIFRVLAVPCLAVVG